VRGLRSDATARAVAQAFVVVLLVIGGFALSHRLHSLRSDSEDAAARLTAMTKVLADACKAASEDVLAQHGLSRMCEQAAAGLVPTISGPLPPAPTPATAVAAR
jgi:hypothetical protein